MLSGSSMKAVTRRSPDLCSAVIGSSPLQGR
jgi:hypothetical protein